MTRKAVAIRVPDARNYNSKEVLSPASPSSWHGPSLVRNGAEDGKFGIELLVEVHDGGDVAAAVAVVWRGPDRHDVFIFEMILVASVSLSADTSPEMGSLAL